MAGEFPLPVRVVAGALATGFDRLRRLPQDLPGLSVTVAGQAVRASMRVQQEVAQLAGRGEELLTELFTRPAEHPTWAHFDEDDDAEAAGSDPKDADPAEDCDGDEAAGDRDGHRDGEASTGHRDSRASAGNDAATDRKGPAGHRAAGRVNRRATPGDRAAAPVDRRATPGSRRATPGASHPADDPAPGPVDLPGYDDLRLPQIRARLRSLDADAVARLLEHERSGAARAAFLTVLGNRLTTLRAGDGPDRST
jgi:hypothetical protein